MNSRITKKDIEGRRKMTHITMHLRKKENKTTQINKTQQQQVKPFWTQYLIKHF